MTKEQIVRDLENSPVNRGQIQRFALKVWDGQGDLENPNSYQYAGGGGGGNLPLPIARYEGDGFTYGLIQMSGNQTTKYWVVYVDDRGDQQIVAGDYDSDLNATRYDMPIFTDMDKPYVYIFNNATATGKPVDALELVPSGVVPTGTQVSVDGTNVAQLPITSDGAGQLQSVGGLTLPVGGSGADTNLSNLTPTGEAHFSKLQLGNTSTTAMAGDTHIPSDQVNSDWNATSGVEQILNKPTDLLTQSDANQPVSSTNKLATMNDITPSTSGANQDLSNLTNVGKEEIAKYIIYFENTIVNAFISSQNIIPNGQFNLYEIDNDGLVIQKESIDNNKAGMNITPNSNYFYAISSINLSVGSTYTIDNRTKEIFFNNGKATNGFIWGDGTGDIEKQIDLMNWFVAGKDIVDITQLDDGQFFLGMIIPETQDIPNVNFQINFKTDTTQQNTGNPDSLQGSSNASGEVSISIYHDGIFTPIIVDGVLSPEFNITTSGGNSFGSIDEDGQRIFVANFDNDGIGAKITLLSNSFSEVVCIASEVWTMRDIKNYVIDKIADITLNVDKGTIIGSTIVQLPVGVSYNLALSSINLIPNITEENFKVEQKIICYSADGVKVVGFADVVALDPNNPATFLTITFHPNSADGIAIVVGSEVLTNETLNGQPIYAQCFTGALTLMANGKTGAVISIPDANGLVSYGGNVMVSSSNNNVPIPSLETDNSGQILRCISLSPMGGTTSGSAYQLTAWNCDNSPYIITIKYTKPV